MKTNAADRTESVEDSEIIIVSEHRNDTPIGKFRITRKKDCDAVIFRHSYFSNFMDSTFELKITRKCAENLRDALIRSFPLEGEAKNQ